MKYSLIQGVFIVETYIRNKSYKKCCNEFRIWFSCVSFYFKINSVLTDEFFLEKKQDQTQHIISEETSDNTGVHLKTCQQKSLL